MKRARATEAARLLADRGATYAAVRRGVRALLGKEGAGFSTCPDCRYDLRAATTRCPECRRAIEPARTGANEKDHQPIPRFGFWLLTF
jgi:hypothetical protein